ncbi:MAG TPA: hypothetical protein VF398_12185, partial [bacterium]
NRFWVSEIGAGHGRFFYAIFSRFPKKQVFPCFMNLSRLNYGGLEPGMQFLQKQDESSPSISFIPAGALAGGMQCAAR